jgi:molybdenum cofactor cytidylyltransferase
MGGQPKPLLRFDARDTFVTRIIRTFAEAGIGDVQVVVGHAAEAVTAAVEQSGLSARCVFNAAFQEGQFSSLLTGLNAVDRPEVEALLLALVDAPLFSADTVRAVVHRFEQTHAPVVRAVRASEHGHPVLIARALFAELRAADPSRGAKPIVRANASAAGDVEVVDPGAFIDIDTPEDYEQLPALLRHLNR